MEKFAQSQDLKIMLDTQKDLSQLDEIGELRILVFTNWHRYSMFCLVRLSVITIDLQIDLLKRALNIVFYACVI